MTKLIAVITAASLMVVAFATPLAHAAPPVTTTLIIVGGHGDTTGGWTANELRSKGLVSPSPTRSSKSPTWPTLLAVRRPPPKPPAKSSPPSTPTVSAPLPVNCTACPPATNPIIRAARQLGVPCGDVDQQACPPYPQFTNNKKVVLHASPNPLTGAWHSLNNQSFVDSFDPYSASFTVKELPTPGMEHWYHQDDYIANKAPQCFNNAALLYMARRSQQRSPRDPAEKWCPRCVDRTREGDQPRVRCGSEHAYGVR